MGAARERERPAYSRHMTRRRVSGIATRILFLSLLAVLPPLPAGAGEPVAQREQMLRVGDQLESQRRWGDAITHYEKALKQNPGRRELQDRLITSRFHYEIGRRYVDSSFLETVAAISEQDALDLYGEVLLKVHAHYVEPPNWNLLLDHGLKAIEVALSESAFYDRHQLVVKHVRCQQLPPL